MLALDPELTRARIFVDGILKMFIDGAHSFLSPPRYAELNMERFRSFLRTFELLDVLLAISSLQRTHEVVGTAAFFMPVGAFGNYVVVVEKAIDFTLDCLCGW